MTENVNDNSAVGQHLIQGTALPYVQDNVDTDQILPKQFLTRITREGYGQFLFNDLRYLDGDSNHDNPDFVLNQPQYQGANMLLAGKNFGCGSSREHAPWAIADYGFEVVIAENFADIFYTNCINNNITPVALNEAEVALLQQAITRDPSTQLQVNLEKLSISTTTHEFSFHLDENHQRSLILRQDKIDMMLAASDQIRAYEQQVPLWRR